jgi:hypothetical protein
MAENELTAGYVPPNPANEVSGVISSDHEPQNPALASHTGFHLHKNGGYALPRHDEDDQADGM